MTLICPRSTGTDCAAERDEINDNTTCRAVPLSTGQRGSTTPVTFGVLSIIRFVCLLSVFSVMIVQLHLIFDKIVHSTSDTRNASINCDLEISHLPPPTAITKTVYRKIRLPAQTIYQTIVQNVTLPPKIVYVTRNFTRIEYRYRNGTSSDMENPRGRRRHDRRKLLPLELPFVTKQGMMIVFLNIPWTGGNIIRQLFRHHRDWRYIHPMPMPPQSSNDEITSTLQNWIPGTKLFYEHMIVDGENEPSMMDWKVRDDLNRWRAMARIRNIPFFAFTIVRNPIGFVASQFREAKRGSSGGDGPTSEQEFLHLVQPNPQCSSYCARRCSHEITSSHNNRSHSTQQDPHNNQQVLIEAPSDLQKCKAVYDALKQDLDWIGTTERLSRETLPILQQMIANVQPDPVVTFRDTDIEDVPAKSNFSETATAHVWNATRGDNLIYQRTLQDFPVTMWMNFRPTAFVPDGTNDV
ncbi:expressed unknown protein [Seminavis robusta]|uniref:Uncharacterized protein n=1 Tax=Seminavis robusta TaxID=568900 RepID=A0A9N8DR43_9STRA|nr:expressed unknown protein [Seminavis robusta]|eukprot:Sro279_g106740.1 n/a (466) ;mRNA; r:24020-25417